MRRRHALSLAALACALALPPLLGSPADASTGEQRHRATSAPPGLAGDPRTLADQQDISGVDIAVDADGTTYIGWIASTPSTSDRRVFLCGIPAGQTACHNGIQQTASLGPSSASGLRVLVQNGTPTLVWFHDTDGSVNGPMNGEVATATVGPDMGLSAAADRAAAPSFGELRDAVVGPDGLIWTVTAASGGDDSLYVRDGFAVAAKKLDPPWLTFRNSLTFPDDRPLLVVDEYGLIGAPLRFNHLKGDGTWSGFTKIPGTWTVGGAFDTADTRGTTRLVAPVADASYSPRVAAWDTSDFGPFTFTGDRNACAPPTHDLFRDPSGRLADTSNECGKLTVVNQPTAGKAAIVRFAFNGTPRGEPQIGTTSRGRGWVAWAVTSTTGWRLRAAPVRLPALPRTASDGSRGGSVTVTGPVSCMPAVDLPVKAVAHTAKGWRLRSRTFTLDGDAQGGTLHGAGLAPGSQHTLLGRAVFARDADRSTATARLTFTACP